MKYKLPDRYMLGLAFGALGIVYGDIGTSPLYALRECFYGNHSVAVNEANVLGVLSLVFWSLVIVISIKYVALVMRADNQGEGGILALLALAFPERRTNQTRLYRIMVGLGLFGTALLYGDGMITPAISVLSAVEGLKVATPFFKPFIIPITIGVLVGLFSFQYVGTDKVGKIFGPVTFTWFLSLTALGIHGIVQEPAVLDALSPSHAIQFFIENGWTGFVVLGSVFLVVTGGEALYADMGHFGKNPIRLAWFGLVLPSLVVNYFGQGALLLAHPKATENPFYELAPVWAIYPLVVLATMATVVASQALISGAFSLTMQAVQLGYSPRMKIKHTSPDEKGQIYVPRINKGLIVACISLVIIFQSSSRLAGAYGVAVSLTMIITTLLFFFAAHRVWKWSWLKAGAICLPFLCVETAFFAANSLKILQGGWFPLMVGGMVFAVMTTWRDGRKILRNKLIATSLPFETFLEDMAKTKPLRVPGTAIFLSGNSDGTPIALLHNLKHNKILHERVILMTIETEEAPHVDKSQRVDIQSYGNGFYRIIGRYGFMEDPAILEILGRCKQQELEFKLEATTFFISRQTIVPARKRFAALWRGKLFAFLARNAESPTDFFRLPANQVVEFGMHIEM